MTTTTWQDISRTKIAARDAKIPAAWHIAPPTSTNVMDVPATCGVLSARELEITSTPGPALVAAMVAHTYTAEEVAVAFCKRAAIAQQLTNCLTEIMFEECIAAARELDAEYAATGTPRGPMHGLPVSLKDNVNVPGYDSTIGFISHCNQPMGVEDECDLVKVLRDAGSVFHCKTNVPTGMLMGDTYNNVWGHTSNPYNTEYGAGGSSGGEAALLALRGSPLGIGSDIGGSVRMPSSITGLYGIKSAAGRFPNLGCKSGLPGQETVRGVQGPMSPDLESIELWTKVVLESKPWERDPGVYPVEWKEVQLPEKLCFGMMTDDGTVRPTPAVQRALAETKAALEKAGHTVIDWTPYNPVEGQALLWRSLLGDGGKKIHAQVRETPYPEPWPKDLELFNDRYQATKGTPPTINDLWETNVARNKYIAKLLKSWADTKELTGTGRPIDGLISPVLPFPAAPRYEFTNHIGYTGLWNLADHAGTVVPVTFARASDVIEQPLADVRNEMEKMAWEKYDPKRLEGMPVGIQIVTPRHTEERGLKLAGVTAKALKASQKK